MKEGRRGGKGGSNNTVMKVYKHKFNAIKTECDGIKFASKKEAAYYKKLLLRKSAGDVVFFLRQVPIHLPGGVRYVVDFLEFHADETVHFCDVKGMKTEQYKTKKRMVEALYPIQIEEK